MPLPTDDRPSLLPFDFSRLVRSVAQTVMWAGKGSYPRLPRALELENHSFATLALEGYLLKIHAFLVDFLDLEEDLSLGKVPEVPSPQKETLIRDYAGGLYRSFEKRERKTLAFTGKDQRGETRRTVHDFAALVTEADRVAFLFSGRKRVLLTVPLVHSFGFTFGLLGPRLLKIPSLDLAPRPALADHTLLKGDLLVLFPQLLKKLQVEPPPDVALLCSSSPPLDERYFRTARNMGFLSLAEVYGTTLTGALGHRKAAGPFELFSHFRRDGERRLFRIDTGTYFTSRRLVWRKERHFSHWPGENQLDPKEASPNG